MELGILILRATAALAAALAVASWYRNGSAALRHFVLTAGVATAVLTLPLSRLMPAWEMAPPAAAERPTVESEAAPPPPGDVAVVMVKSPAMPPAGRRWNVRAPEVAFAAWSIGAVAFAAPLFLGLIGLRRLTAAAAPVDDERWLSLRDEIAAGLGVRRRVPLLWANMAVGTWGLLRPRIVLPAEALAWDDARARAVLAHELAHVRRGDWAVQVAADTLRAVFWFNPLSWIVARRLRDESERACDDAVLDTGVQNATYASHLLDIARASRGAAPAAAMAMARSSTLEGRITAMLNPTIDRRLPSRNVRLATVVALLVVACAAAVRVAAQVAGPAPLQGTVYDASGGVLPGVEMALVNEQGIKWCTPTDGEGRFEFAPVGAGKYVLEATIPGLRTLNQAIVLERPKDWTRILTMQVGELQETIQVTARRPRTPVAPANAATAGPVRVGGNIKPPKKVAHVNPIYPESMRAAGLEGVVKLDVLIATDGTLASVRVLNSEAHPDFGVAASAAVRQWKFTPTLLNGQAVEVAMTVSMSFSLSD